jgi:MinD superfamily P-loop ATPase
MGEWKSFARIRLESCRQCGRPLTFCSQFKAMGEKRFEVCEWCKKCWMNGEAQKGQIEVGQ